MDRSAVARYLIDESQLVRQLERDYLLTGIENFDAESGGLPKGAITEIAGPVSCGKTTLLTSLLARSTTAGEFCALVDGADSFDPACAAAAGTALSRLLWVRCHGVEEALKAADLLVHAGGWGVIALDLSGIAPSMVRRIPMSWWYRFRRAVEPAPTAFLVLEREPFVKNCAAMMIDFRPSRPVWSGIDRDFRVLRGADIDTVLRKPVGSKGSVFRAESCF